MDDIWRDGIMREFGTRFELEPDTTALVVVDMQLHSADRHIGLGRHKQAQGQAAALAYRFDRIEQVVVPRVQQALAYFRRHGLRVVHTTFGADTPDFSDMPLCFRNIAQAINARVGHPDHAILPAVQPLAGELVVNKPSASPFNSTGIDRTLRNMGVRSLVITGISTHMCVLTTARDAADRGYAVVVAEDACAADSPALHEAALALIGRIFCQVQPLEAILARLASGSVHHPATHSLVAGP
jgi:nicotinamidase-related amidase